MNPTTITLSSKGQFALPKKLRAADHLDKSDMFRLERVGPGKYLLEKLTPPARPKAALVRSKDGFLVFRSPKGAPTITSAQVRQLEAETI
jgi:bifunctional DNA-binding transcriptional regulator/antitoxin component of YhaV-PrlF toxin-antitoxin module